MYLLLAIHIAWTLGAVPLVTRQKRLPASAAAWLALILLLPQYVPRGLIEIDLSVRHFGQIDEAIL